ncbi:MAG: ribonuclease R, partial [Pseudomonadota bacterium]
MTLPSKTEVLDWIRSNPGHASKRDVAKAFGIKGAERIDLKRILRELEADGLIQRDRKEMRDPDTLPPVAVLHVTGLDADGEVLAEPVTWTSDLPIPKVLLQSKPGGPALGAGDRLLARCHKTEEGYEGSLIRRIATSPSKLIGIYRHGREEGRILPIDKKSDREWRVSSGDRGEARDG